MNNHFEDGGQFSEIWQRALESSWRRYSLVKLTQVIRAIFQSFFEIREKKSPFLEK